MPCGQPPLPTELHQALEGRHSGVPCLELWERLCKGRGEEERGVGGGGEGGGGRRGGAPGELRVRGKQVPRWCSLFVLHRGLILQA